jgi:hypothetical protein
MNAYRFARSLPFLFLAGVLAACAVPGRAAISPAEVAAAQSLRPGDRLGSMTLTTGSDAALSLWTACRPAADGSRRDCRVPAGPLAVGPSAAALSEMVNQAEWGLLKWSLLIDGRPVDLDSFGTFEFAQPRKALHGRDALFIYRGWDVVVASPTPGEHTLQASVTRLMHSAKELGLLNETATWMIDFVVE